MRMQIRFALERHAACEVIESATGAEALEQLESVTLIVSEISSANVDGLELLATVKASLPDLPVILLAAYEERDLLAEARQKGAAAWVVKPIDPLKLAAALAQLSAQ